MSGSCVEKLSHSCGTKDALQVFLEDGGKYTGYCFACDTFVPDPYEDKEESKEESKEGSKEGSKEDKIYNIRKEVSKEDIKKEIEEVSKYRTTDIASRRLKRIALEHFGIKIGVSEVDGTTPITIHFPRTKRGVVVGWKNRFVEEKKFWSIGEGRDVDLFGWNQALSAGSPRLYITEGELDAVALYQTLKERAIGTQWEALEPAVVSLPNGSAGAAKAIVSQINEITKNFNEVILVFDNDEAGKKAQDEVSKILPLAKAAELPAKDANACLIEGKAKALCNAVLFKASVPKNTRIVAGSSLYELGRQQAQWGLSWPWEKMTELTRGIRWGETIYIGAGVKMGKSEVVKHLVKHFMVEHNLPVFVASPEESNRKTYQLILGKVAGKIFHDPKIPFDYEAYDAAAKAVGDKLYLLDIYQHLGWETLKHDIIVAAQEGVKAVFIDPITNLTNGINSADANTKLQEVAQEIAVLAKDLELAVFLFCHLKSPTAGDPHERGGSVLSYQFSGSRAMMRSCNYMIGVEGDKNPDLPPELRNIRSLVLLEDREFGNVGKVKLYWDETKGLFNEIVEEE